MKKTYINPSMEVIKIASQSQMLAGSLQGNWNESKDPTNADGRGFGDFDDFEEDF